MVVLYLRRNWMKWCVAFIPFFALKYFLYFVGKVKSFFGFCFCALGETVYLCFAQEYK